MRPKVEIESKLDLVGYWIIIVSLLSLNALLLVIILNADKAYMIVDGEERKVIVMCDTCPNNVYIVNDTHLGN